MRMPAVDASTNPRLSLSSSSMQSHKPGSVKWKLHPTENRIYTKNPCPTAPGFKTVAVCCSCGSPVVSLLSHPTGKECHGCPGICVAGLPSPLLLYLLIFPTFYQVLPFVPPVDKSWLSLLVPFPGNNMSFAVFKASCCYDVIVELCCGGLCWGRCQQIARCTTFSLLAFKLESVSSASPKRIRSPHVLLSVNVVALLMSHALMY